VAAVGGETVVAPDQSADRLRILDAEALGH
jgi:hypothetical protein